MDSVFQRLYDNYHQDVFQFLFYMVKNKETAEDLMQEVYMKVLRSYGSFEGKSSEKTWIFSIARNTAIDFFRKEKRWKHRIFPHFDWLRESISDEAPLPYELAELKDEIQAVYKGLDRCTVDQRSVLLLRYTQSLSIAETAEILGWTESKVKTTQHRGLKAIREILHKEDGKEGTENE
ncbi:MAG: RNA polymerase sigma factor SigX [Bacillus sp. (in: firmicutes)]